MQSQNSEEKDMVLNKLNSPMRRLTLSSETTRIQMTTGLKKIQVGLIECFLIVFKQHIDRGNEETLSLSPDQLWYEWGGDNAGFSSRKRFQRFLEIAGMDKDTKPLMVVKAPYNSERYVYRSPEKDVVVVCNDDPMQNKWGYVHYLGVTGERGKVMNMADWYEANCTDAWAERGERGYI